MVFSCPQVKARRYVEVGSETYRRHDLFLRSDASMMGGDRAVVPHEMSQLVKGIGAVPDRPFIGLGIRRLNDMAHTLHLEGGGIARR
jgi:hypothetical protein